MLLLFQARQRVAQDRFYRELIDKGDTLNNTLMKVQIVGCTLLVVAVGGGGGGGSGSGGVT